MQVQRLDKRGYVTLLATIVVTFLGMGLALSLIERSGVSQTATLVLERSFYARNYADACAEKALLSITQTESFSGTQDFDFDHGTCTYSVVPEVNQSTVESIGRADQVIRKVRVMAQTNTVVGQSGTTTQIATIEWSEVADF